MPVPTDYQMEGVAFLVERTRALLADEPGLGKSGQVIVAAQKIGAQNACVICPAVARFHWRREWQKWWSDGLTPVVLSYDEASRETLWRQCVWDVLVIDESHYAKNPTAARTRAIFAKGGGAYGARRIWCLTGTPTPNHPGELWVMLRAFGATKLSYQAYCERYCILDREGRIRGAYKPNIPELREIVRPYVLRRMAKDVLPDIKMNIEEYTVQPRTDWLALMGTSGVDWDGKKTSASALAEEAALRAQLESAQDDDAILAALNRNPEKTALYRRYLGIVKAPATYELVKFELANGIVDKLVVYGYHVEPLGLMYQKAKRDGIKAEMIYGGTPPKARDAAITRFTRPRGSRVLFANMVAAGVAIDLTAAHEGIMFETDWTPDKNIQPMMRMRRYGQKELVRMRIISAAGTLDERISAVVARKTADIVALWE